MHIVTNIRNLSKFKSLYGSLADSQALSDDQFQHLCYVDNQTKAHHYDLLIAQVTRLGATVTETHKGVERSLQVGEWLVAPLVGRESTLGHSSVLPATGVTVGQEIDYISTGGGLGFSGDNPPGKADPTKVLVKGILRHAEQDRIARAQDFALDLPKATKLKPVVVVVGSKSDAGKTTICLDIIKGLFDKGLKVGVAKISGTQQRLEIQELAVHANEAYDAADAGMPTTYPPSQESDTRTDETSKLVLEAADRIVSALSVQNNIIVAECGGDLLSASVPELLADPRRLNIVAIVMAAESATAAIGMETKLRRISKDYAQIPQYVAGPAANLKANRNRILRETSCSGCFDLWTRHDNSAATSQRKASADSADLLIAGLLKLSV